MSSDLEDFLQQYSDLVLVTFWEENSEASAYMAQLLRRIEQLREVPVLRLELSEHRVWAHTHGVHGTPALIVYYKHQPLFRVIGRVTPEELLQCFQNLKLEAPRALEIKSVGETDLTLHPKLLNGPECSD